jgi:hypothetical protein
VRAGLSRPDDEIHAFRWISAGAVKDSPLPAEVNPTPPDGEVSSRETGDIRLRLRDTVLAKSMTPDRRR